MNFLLFLICFYIFATSILSFFLIYIYILPSLKRRFKKYKYLQVSSVDDYDFIKRIFEASIKMSYSKKSLMPVHDNNDFIIKIYSLVHRKQLQKEHYYSFSRAFLLWSITEYLLVNNVENNEKIIKNIGNWVKDDGSPVFTLKYVDRIVFGLVSLNLYKLTRQEKYKKNSDFTFNHTLKLTGKDGLIKYLEKDYPTIQFVDILGMVCPFLINYGKTFANEKAIFLAKKNLDFYLENGVDNNFLPYQFINFKSKIGIGTNNWGRGISWYILGLCSAINLDPKYDKYANNLWYTLQKLRINENDETWSQFPGASMNYDSSATLPFIYLANHLLKDTYSINKIKNLLSKYITRDGFINGTSGVPWGIGLHSDKFGFSEFSQGMLLLLITKSEINAK